MTEEDARQAIRDAVDEAGSQSRFAKQSGISQAFISDVLLKKRSPSPRLLRAVGLEWRLTPVEGPK